MATKRKSRHTFGTAEQLPSGRWQATYRHEGNQFTAAAPRADTPKKMFSTIGSTYGLGGLRGITSENANSY